jgi:CAAX amino terminal protease family.
MENQNEKFSIKETTIRLIPILLLSAIYSVAGIILFHQELDAKGWAIQIIKAVSAGFLEELIFRLLILGIIFKKTDESKHIPSIYIVSLIFGIAHISNYFGGKYEFYIIVMQIIGATFAGVMFGYMYYHTRNYLFCALIHTFYDFGVFIISIGAGDLALLGKLDLASEIITLFFPIPIIIGLLKRNKKYLIIDLVVGTIVVIAIASLKIAANLQ